MQITLVNKNRGAAKICYIYIYVYPERAAFRQAARGGGAVQRVGELGTSGTAWPGPGGRGAVGGQRQLPPQRVWLPLSGSAGGTRQPRPAGPVLRHVVGQGEH